VVISDEARELAAQARQRWNAGEMTQAERDEFSREQWARIFGDRQPMSEREMLATGGTHNLLGAFEFTAGNGQDFVARIGTDGIWISTEGWTRSAFVQIDPSSGVPGIDQPTVRMLDFIQQMVMSLREALPPEDNNLYSPEGITGNQESLRALVDSFEAIRDNTPQGHRQSLEDAFRFLLNNFFDESARQANMLPEGSSPSEAELSRWREQIQQAIEESRVQAGTFANAFFANLNQHGVQGAFDRAWAAVID